MSDALLDLSLMQPFNGRLRSSGDGLLWTDAQPRLVLRRDAANAEPLCRM